jgi:hypothetical protein
VAWISLRTTDPLHCSAVCLGTGCNADHDAGSDCWRIFFPVKALVDPLVVSKIMWVRNSNSLFTTVVSNFFVVFNLPTGLCEENRPMDVCTVSETSACSVLS